MYMTIHYGNPDTNKHTLKTVKKRLPKTHKLY